MRESNRRSCDVHRSLLTLPLLLVAVGCGSDGGASQVGGTTPPGYVAGSGTMLNLPPPGGSGGSGNGSVGDGTGATGPYMLPVGYTKANKGGSMLGPAIDASATGGASSTGGSTSGCGTSILGVVRDFKGVNEPDGHPDFEAFMGSDPSLGIVKDDLGSDQKPVYNGTGPIIDPANGQQTTGKANFDQWYRATPNVNKPYVVYFYFEPNSGVLTFDSNAFFPLDGAGWGNSCHEADAKCQPQPHNYGFTTELHTQFSYKGGESFSFTGDDDLWVFINHKLAIDLGGLHQSRMKVIKLNDQAQKLGITIGNTYDLDLFHAERHTVASDFRVDTNLAFTNCGTIVDEPPVK